MVKRLQDMEKFKNISVYSVFTEKWLFLGIFRVYFREKTDNPDVSTIVEVQEIENRQLSMNYRQYIGFSDISAIVGENIFGIDIKSDNFTDIRDYLTYNGLKVVICL